jgi:hypothetical protein
MAFGDTSFLVALINMMKLVLQVTDLFQQDHVLDLSFIHRGYANKNTYLLLSEASR